MGAENAVLKTIRSSGHREIKQLRLRASWCLQIEDAKRVQVGCVAC
jgi:hypothetical protein